MLIIIFNIMYYTGRRNFVISDSVHYQFCETPHTTNTNPSRISRLNHASNITFISGVLNLACVYVRVCVCVCVCVCMCVCMCTLLMANYSLSIRHHSLTSVQSTRHDSGVSQMSHYEHFCGQRGSISSLTSYSSE